MQIDLRYVAAQYYRENHCRGMTFMMIRLSGFVAIAFLIGQVFLAGLLADENRATPVERIKVPKDFRVELLCSVPMAEQGSWINLCTDDRGRILVSDQYGGLFRFAPPRVGKPLAAASIERVPAKVRAVNGMVWAFNALYVAVNDYEKQIPSGLYRVTDSDGDDQLDRVELLREM